MTSIIKVNTIQDVGGNNLLISNGSGSITTNNIGGQNTPAFHAQKTDSQQSIAFETYTKVTFNNEILDTDSKYASDKFTPTVAGYYYVYGSWGINTSAEVFQMRCDIYKNGSSYQTGRSYSTELGTASVGAIVYLDADDYVEIYARQDRTGSASASIQHNEGQTFFGAYRIIGA